jgi:hypothetical protein
MKVTLPYYRITPFRLLYMRPLGHHIEPWSDMGRVPYIYVPSVVTAAAITGRSSPCIGGGKVFSFFTTDVDCSHFFPPL